MKCVFIVNRMNDVLFIDCDDEFAVYLNRQGENCYQQDGDSKAQTEGPQTDAPSVDTSLIMQLFSPLVLSNWGLIVETKNPCSSVTCENGFIFVFRQMDEFLFIAINGDGMENEDFLHKKLQIFYRLIRFLFGPVTDEIGHSRFEDKKRRWNFLRRLLDTWQTLYHEEQSFLVEAIERLHVTSELNEKCMLLLEELISELKKVVENSAKHVLLLVNSKLLSLYSDWNVSELMPADILYITLLVHDLFPPAMHLDDMLSQSYSTTSHQYRDDGRTSMFFSSTTTPVQPPREEESEEDQEYLSAASTPGAMPATPSSERSRSPSCDTEQGQRDDPQTTDQSASGTSHSSSYVDSVASSPYPSISVRGDEYETFYTPDSEGKLLAQRSSSDTQSSRSHSGRSSHSSSDVLVSTLAKRSTLSDDRWGQMVFLQTGVCPLSPHYLHCRLVLPGIVLVTVIQDNRNVAAAPLCKMFDYVKALLSGKKENLNNHVYDVIKTLISKVQSALKHDKQTDVKRLITELQTRWDNNALKNNLYKYLEDSNEDELNTGLETSLMDVHKKLKYLFSVLYLSPQHFKSKLQNAIQTMTEKIGKQLSDYKTFLFVKAHRNIPMTSYFNEFPGLIHFIYTDSQRHHLIAPSINVTSTDGEMEGTKIVKDKVWQMFELLRQKLSEGYTSVIVREGDFYFSHFVWFEDSIGSLISVQQPFKPNTHFPPPGILIGPFFRYLIKQCFPNSLPGTVHCYELFMMHTGLIHPRFIAAHCRQLARKLGEMSGKTFSQISLL